MLEIDLKSLVQRSDQWRVTQWLRSSAASLQGVAAWLLWLGLGLLAIFFAFVYGSRPSADIALEVNPADRLLIKGVVLYRGEPVESGKLQLVVADALSTHHLASVVMDVTKAGFSNEGSPMDGLKGIYNHRELRINAHFWGRVAAADGHENEVLDIERTVYSNCSTPITRQEVLWFLAGFCAFVLVVISLFTMELTQWRARWLFAASYAATFFSVAFPLFAIIYVSQSPYLIDVMKTAPIGLVRARSQPAGSLPTVDPQWLLNVGGVLMNVNGERAATGSDSTATPDTPVKPMASIAKPQAALQPLDARSAEATASTTRVSEPAGKGEEHQSADANVVAGGLAIPFYVIILAIFGASINMMRKVPRIHAKHMVWLPREIASIGLANGARAAERKGTDAGCSIRQELIEQHMYLLAAPFLAIAVYYLLQVLAKDVAQPVVVLMGFAAGLISERIVSTLIDFAQARLGSDGPVTSSEPGPPGEGSSPIGGEEPNGREAPPSHVTATVA